MLDIRAFHQLSEFAGRAAVMELIETDGHSGRLRFDAYSADPLHYLRVREAVNQQITAIARYPQPTCVPGVSACSPRACRVRGH